MLNPEEINFIKQRLPFVQAIAEGKAVECKYVLDKDWKPAAVGVLLSHSYAFRIPDPAAERLARNAEVKASAEAMTWSGLWFIDQDGRAWTVHVDGKGPICPNWGSLHTATYELRPVPIPEQNAATRKAWEAMKETDDKAFRVDAQGRRCRVEYRHAADENRSWCKNDNFLRTEIRAWAENETFLYRITPLPAPTVEPWTFDDIPSVTLKVRRKSDGELCVAFAYPSEIGVFTNASEWSYITYTQLRDDFEQLSGAACGRLAATEKGAK